MNNNPIKRLSGSQELDVLDTTGSKLIPAAIRKMEEALKQKDTRAFEEARDEVESLFRLYGYAE